MRNLDPERARWMKVRMVLLAACLFVFAGAVVRRAYNVQIKQGPELRQMAEDQYLRDIRLAPKRGTIFDRSGAELAVSVDVDSVWANPRELRAKGGNPQTVAVELTQVLGGNPQALATKLSQDRFFVWVERRITPAQSQLVKSLNLPGIAMSRESRRYYPNRDLAAHVLGFANVDGIGVEGVEKSYEDKLRGSVSSVPAIRDRRGTVVFSEQLLDDRAAQGADLELTIDKTIQAVAEQELMMAIRTTEARAGTAIVIDPQTGEIYALANYPTFNPNEPGDSPPNARRNRAITDRFEPGSTVKPFTVSGALAAGAITPEEIFDCEMGAMRVAEYTIHDSHPMGLLTPAQILAHSSNIGTAKIGAALGRADLYRTFRRFGIGELTGIELPGETAGILRNYRHWYDMDAATIAFGQGVSVTALQLAYGMAALSNGGRLMEPIIVRRVLDGHGDVLEEHLPHVKRQVIPQGTSRLVSDMLTAVTGPGGTGVEAAIDGYLVGGKTGTAQKADYVSGGYAKDQWMSSFVGFVPASRPRLVIAVVIDEPIIEHYGGLVSGPVFRRIGEAALRHLGVPPDGAGDALAQRARTAAEARSAAHVAHAHDVAACPPGSPCAQAAAAEGVTITDARTPTLGEVRVPNVVGMTARRALATLSANHLTADIEGSGIVASQTPASGSIAARSSSVRVVLNPPDFRADEPPTTTARAPSAQPTLARVEGHP